MNIILLCIEIFFARILDVSIGVIRTIELVKDNTIKAVILAFFEVFVWFIIARVAITNELNIFIAIFYSLGYATGTLIGSYLSKKYIKGSVSIEVISSLIKNKDIKYIKSKGYGLSSLTLDDNKKLLIIEVNKSNTNNLISIIKSLDNNAFITVRDTKYAYNGYIK